MQTINVMAPINTLGYGVVGLNVTIALAELGYNVVLFPLGRIEEQAVPSQEVANLITASLAKQADWNPDHPSLRIWHEFALAEHVGNLRVAYPFFEIDSFDTRRKNHLSAQDLVFVASEWAKNVINKECPKVQCEVAELGVNRQIFKPLPRTADNRPITFLQVGKFSINKGHDVLVDAFNKAFEPQDNVELWLSCENPFCTESETDGWHSLFKRSKMGEKIRIFPRLQSQIQLAQLMSQADCGIFLSRGEAWNLEILEMMSCGIPSIVTNYSGHTQFCNEENSFLVPISNLEPAYDGKFFLGDCGEWGSFDDVAMDAIVEHLRNVYQNRLFLDKSNSCLQTAETFSWLNTGAKISNGIGKFDPGLFSYKNPISC